MWRWAIKTSAALRNPTCYRCGSGFDMWRSVGRLPKLDSLQGLVGRSQSPARTPPLCTTETTGGDGQTQAGWGASFRCRKPIFMSNDEALENLCKATVRPPYNDITTMLGKRGIRSAASSGTGECRSLSVWVKTASTAVK